MDSLEIYLERRIEASVVCERTKTADEESSGNPSSSLLWLLLPFSFSRSLSLFFCSESIPASFSTLFLSQTSAQISLLCSRFFLSRSSKKNFLSFSSSLPPTLSARHLPFGFFLFLVAPLLFDLPQSVASSLEPPHSESSLLFSLPFYRFLFCFLFSAVIS